MSLDPRATRFVDAYAVSGNGAEAAALAGYSRRCSKVQASRLLTRANVQEALRAKRQEIEHELGMSRQNVLAGLQAAADAARLKGDGMAMVRAWSEIAKVCGYYEQQARPVKPQKAPRGAMRRFECMTDEELMARWQQGCAIS